MHEKSYCRLLQWYIANGEIEKANLLAKDIKSKFSYNLANFKANLDALDSINKKFEMDDSLKGKRKVKKPKSKPWLPWLVGGVAVVASGLLTTLLIKRHKGLI